MPSRSIVRNLSLSALLLGAISIGSPACSDTPTFDGTDSPATGGSSGACVVPDKTQCGVSCSSDAGCAQGLYCDTGLGTCQAECVAGTAAAPECAGQACGANGHCVGGSGTGGGGNGAGGSSIVVGDSGGGSGEGGGNNCIDVEVTPTPIIPNVVLLIDRSLSMTGESGYAARVQEAIDALEYTPWECTGPVVGGPVGGGDAEFWRWNVVRSVLFNPDDGVVSQLGDRVRFGMTTYSANGGTCPVLTDVGLAFDNRDAMLAGFPCSSLVQETPTRESLGPTADTLAALSVEGPKFIVLATDGAPDSCACPNFGGGTPPCNDVGAQAAEMDAVVAEATRVHDVLGITLDVIDVSSPGQTIDGIPLHDHLTAVATAGGGEAFDGTDPAGLIDAFEKIIGDALSCVIQLNGTISHGKEATGEVKLGDDELTYEEDWVVPQPDQIELIGEACTTYKRDSPTLTVQFPCDAFIIK